MSTARPTKPSLSPAAAAAAATPGPVSAGVRTKTRLASLDQFRGYTVAGMFLVNYLGWFLACPFILRHHNTFCSYADTIMPQFFFAVGFSLRLSFGRRAIEQGLGGAYWHVVKRLLGLALVAIFITYQGSLPKGVDSWSALMPKGIDSWSALKKLGLHAVGPNNWKREWFQTLMHIAVTSLWILPVIRLKARWRILYMILSAALHFFLSYQFNFFWVNGVPATNEPGGIDGGPLGFLSWTIPTMMGTVACDLALSPRGRGSVTASLILVGTLFMAVGWLASCLTRCYDVPTAVLEGAPRFAAHPVIPAKEDRDKWIASIKAHDWSKARAEAPFVPPPHSQDHVEGRPVRPLERDEVDNSPNFRKLNYWMMSQRAGSISYLTFGAGLSLAIYALFVVLSDVIGLKIGVFRTLGSNALFGYVLHDITGEAVKKFSMKDFPPTGMWISFAVFFGITWLFIRALEKRNIYIKL